MTAPGPGPRRPASPLRARILEVAADLFYRQGIRAVGVDTIIARAAVAKMTFYRHFPTKDALVVAFLEQRDARWRTWLEAAVTRRAAAPRERLLAVFDALAEWFAAPEFRGCAFVNATVELAAREHPAHALAVRHKQRVEAYIEALAREAGCVEPAGVARALGLLVDGAIVTALREGTPAAAGVARDLAARLLARPPVA